MQSHGPGIFEFDGGWSRLGDVRGVPGPRESGAVCLPFYVSVGEPVSETLYIAADYCPFLFFNPLGFHLFSFLPASLVSALTVSILALEQHVRLEECI